MIKRKNGIISEFKPYDNPTYSIIRIENVEIKVRFSIDNNNEIQLSFVHNETHYTFRIKLKNPHSFFTGDDIYFNGINLNNIDRNVLADNLNAFIDYHCASGY